MQTLKAFIVDDDEIDRLTITSYVKRFPFVEIKGVFSNPSEALKELESNLEIDLLFLDIDMPEMSGLELRKKAIEIPACIFITSYAEHAVESFELDTLDFIVKPLNSDRFQRTMDRVVQFFEVREKAALFESNIGGDFILIKEGTNQTKVKLSDVLYLEALKDYTLIVTPNKKHCVLSGIGTLLKEAHFATFVRIHKSYAVQKFYFERISYAELLLKNGTILPIGRSYRDNLREIL